MRAPARPRTVRSPPHAAAGTRYGGYSAFRGYYLTQEWGWKQGDMDPKRADVISSAFLGPISNRAHALDPSLEVGLSPSLSDAITWSPCPAAYASVSVYKRTLF